MIHTEKEKCKRCDGTGLERTMLDISCFDCNGMGEIYIEERDGK